MSIRSKTPSKCRFCDAPLQDVLVDLGMSPLCESYISEDQLNAMEPFYPLRVYLCRDCMLGQLDEFVSPEEIFSDYAYFSSYSSAWVQHAKEYAHAMVSRLKLGKDSRVIELASNDGYLLQWFVEKKIPVLGIEPAANIAEVARKKGIDTSVAFFGQEVAQELDQNNLRADLIVANNVLAHVNNLNDFVAGMKIALKPTGVITVEFPHLMRLIDENQFDTIYHEHFSYFSFRTAQSVFASHGLTVFDVEELWTHGGSLRVFVRHAEDSSHPILPSVDKLLAQEKAKGMDEMRYYQDFADRVETTKRELLRFLINKKQAKQTVVGYGAPGKGNTLLNYCGVRSDLLAYTVDRNPHKQGKYLPGTHIPIHHPDEIEKTKPDYVLILPWNLKDEIMAQLDFIHEWGGKFVVAIPELLVLPAASSKKLSASRSDQAALRAETVQ